MLQQVLCVGMSTMTRLRVKKRKRGGGGGRKTVTFDSQNQVKTQQVFLISSHPFIRDAIKVHPGFVMGNNDAKVVWLHLLQTFWAIPFNIEQFLFLFCFSGLLGDVHAIIFLMLQLPCTILSIVPKQTSHPFWIVICGAHAIIFFIKNAQWICSFLTETWWPGWWPSSKLTFPVLILLVYKWCGMKQNWLHVAYTSIKTVSSISTHSSALAGFFSCCFFFSFSGPVTVNNNTF